MKPSRKSGPPYLMGLLGLIPLVGFFVGAALLLFGIFKYRSRVLSIIGVACMLFTVIFYYSMYRMSKSADAVSTLWNETAQRQLNALVKDVEFYKLQHGSYPDSLAQVDNAAEFVFSHDPYNYGYTTTKFGITTRISVNGTCFSHPAQTVCPVRQTIFSHRWTTPPERSAGRKSEKGY